LWLLIVVVGRPRSWRKLAVAGAALVPTLLLVALWYPHMRGYRVTTGSDIRSYWFVFPLWRLEPLLLVKNMFGAVKGPLEPFAAAVILLYGMLAVWAARAQRGRTDRGLLVAGLLLLAIALLGPDQYLVTILFSQRWFPLGVALVLLALPAPALPRRWLKRAVPAVLVAFCLSTAWIWRQWEKHELAGLPEALQAVGSNQRLLYLDLAHQSSYLKNRPFMQMAGYAQAEKGGELNFSFAEHGTVLVSYRGSRPITWTPALEWLPNAFKPSDLRSFDLFLLHEQPAQQSSTTASLPLLPLTAPAPWRLYRIAPTATSP
jgi:hypothetical protein